MRYILIFLTLVLVSCGPDSKHIALDGRLLNLNQGEFFVYSPDGAIESVDTITVRGGRFEYEASCLRDGSIVLVMPNGQEIPVFVKPGGSYSIDGDAHNLKELEVKGGDANKLMNSFRKESANVAGTPTSLARHTIEENPDSPVALYLLRKHIIGGGNATYGVMLQLVETVLKAQPDNAQLQMLQSYLKELKAVDRGCRLPAVKATDINGNAVSNLYQGTWVIVSFASWDYESSNVVRRLRSFSKDNAATWRVLAVSMDASKQQCLSAMSTDKEEITIICDEKMTDSPVIRQFALMRTSMALIVKDGVIQQSGLAGEDIFNQLKKLDTASTK